MQNDSFRAWDVLRLGTFCGLGRFGVRTFCSWDVLELGPFVLGRFVVGRFVLGHFVGAPSGLYQFSCTRDNPFFMNLGDFYCCFACVNAPKPSCLPEAWQGISGEICFLILQTNPSKT
jgi:hypothetical protein